MRAAKNHFARALALAGLLLVSACENEAPEQQRQPPGQPEQRNETGEVALLLPYGSDDASSVELARSLENSARLAAADLGSRLILRVYPTKGTADGAVQAARLALDNGASAIVGPVFGASAAAIGPVAAEAAVPVFSFSKSLRRGGRQCLCSWPDPQQRGQQDS